MSMLHDLIQADLFGGGSGGSGSQNAVLYTEQSLTDAQKAQARTNIGAGEPVDAVLYTQQSLTDAQKAQARTNIGAGEPSDGMERFTVAFSLSQGVLVADKSYAEVSAAVTAGKYVEGTFQGQTVPLVCLDSNSAEFRLVTYDSADVYLSVIFLTSNNVCTADNLRLSKEIIEENASSDPVINASANHFYKCGEVATLTVGSAPATGSWSVRFASASPATVLTMPNTVVMPDGFEVEANTIYEINVSDNLALVASWPVVVTTS